MGDGVFCLWDRYLGENSREAVNKLTDEECIAVVRDYLMKACTKEYIVFDLMFAERPFNLRATAKEALDYMDYACEEYGDIRYGGVTLNDPEEFEETVSKSVKRTKTTKSRPASKASQSNNRKPRTTSGKKPAPRRR